MPSYQYVCTTCNNEFTEFYRSFAAGAEFIDEAPCKQCQGKADRVQSVPLQAALYGSPEGYFRPSPTKRFTTKTVSKEDGNQWSGG